MAQCCATFREPLTLCIVKDRYQAARTLWERAGKLSGRRLMLGVFIMRVLVAFVRDLGAHV